ncbi:hypothetical protein BJ170DRAFT_684298 [Xylariales sp. AK1849]|nr:hypothetical protein BJ170DRAFT_684298 [Xylariales sp. AK1849]
MYAIVRITRGILFAAAAGIGISSVAAAQDAVEGSISILQGTDDKGPWNEPRAEFDTLLNSPNATGDFPIAGPNISAPFSSSSVIDGWSWSIAVVANLPIANSSTLAAEYGDKFYTGGKLTFNGPPSLRSSSSQNLTVDDDWQICLFSWQLDGAAYPDELRVDDGTCSSVLSSQCISDIEKAATASHGAGRCECPLSRDIPSCTALGNDSALWDSTCGGSFYNASQIRAWEEGRLEQEVYGGTTAHDRGNITAYNYIGSVAWPVMASFGNGNRTTASMSCVRANTAVEGSTAPTGDGGEAGGQDDQQNSGSRISGHWFVLGIFIILYI